MPFFKKYRKLLHLSQVQVAQELGATQTIVSKIERGELYGRFFVLYMRLLAQNGINVSEFFLGDEALRDYSKKK